MVDVWMHRVGTALRPASADDEESLLKLSPEKLLKVTVKAPRNAAHLRLYWALCGRVAEYVYSDKNMRDLIDEYFKLETGHFSIDKMPNGQMVKRAKSISFDAADQTEFSAYFERCVNVVYTGLKIPPEVVADLLAVEDPRNG